MVICGAYVIKAPRAISKTDVYIRGIAAFIYEDIYYDYFISNNLFIEEHTSGIDFLNDKVRLNKELAKKYFVKSRDI